MYVTSSLFLEVVQEQQLLVGGQRPQTGRNNCFGLITHCSGLDHGLQSQLASQLSLGLLVRSLVDGVQVSLDIRHRGLQVEDGTHLGLFHTGQNVLHDHVHHAVRLDLHSANVLSEHHGLSGRTLFRSEHLHVAEQLHVLRIGVSAYGVHAAVNAPETLAGKHGLVLRVVAVAVEDGLPRSLECRAGHIGGLLALFNGIRELFECVGGDGGQHRVHQRHIL
mmetsp:Transcript_29095/g.39968  ORF Transcript_29095/g.39968 Transcript_29095/m.39968 type:complete len:221 (+) Transcript_29095:216-878(+)